MINASISCDRSRSSTVISLSSVDVADTALVDLASVLQTPSAEASPPDRLQGSSLICDVEERVSLMGERAKKAKGLEESFSLCLRVRLASMIPHPPPPLQLSS